MAIEFDETAYIACGSDASIDDIFAANPNTGSASAWIFADDFGQNSEGRVFDKDNAGSTGWFFAVYDAGGVSTVQFGHYWSGGLARWRAASSAIGLGAWHHVGFTYDGGGTGNNAVFYVDGVLSATTEFAAPSGTIDSDAAQALNIGERTGGSAVVGFDGKLEDLRIWDTTKTAEEFALLAAGYRGPIGGEVGWWDMMTARAAAGAWAGTTLANGTNLLPDLSANSNDGDPTSNPVARESEVPRYGVLV